MRRSVTTCDVCGRHIDEARDVESVYTITAEQTHPPIEFRTDAMWRLPLVVELCGMCWPKVLLAAETPLSALVRTDDEDDD